MTQVRLEEDKRQNDDKYYNPNRKVTMSRPNDYKPYSRSTYEGRHVNSLHDRTNWRKDPNLPPTYDNYDFSISPSVMV